VCATQYSENECFSAAKGVRNDSGYPELIITVKVKRPDSGYFGVRPFS